ncbi:unnamed protein product [Cuscuta campestris]|uniref:DYW domain-containing protein n=1 Tax=Cuscuta campestris TaxID=132261 RepID=A0A484NQK7_9ASTE|nr:unnamed protein product [Cuscuta campestris]
MSHISNHYCSLLKLCCETQSHAQVKKLHCRIIKTISSIETFLLNNLINTYSKIGNFVYARHVFDQIPRPNQFSWNTILSTYSKSGDFMKMEEVFHLIPKKDGVSWNLIISGYASHGSAGKAVRAYELMLRDERMNLNRITFSTMIILCLSNGWIQLGRQIHGQIVKCGFELYVFVGSPLTDMYAKFGLIREAKRVFEELPEKNLVLSNTMIMGFLRCGMVKESERLFMCLPERDSITWTTMITGLTQNGLNIRALDFLREMRLQNFDIDQFTFGSILTACGSVMALEQGKQIHTHAIRSYHMDNIFVGSALVDMYSKCRNIKYAENVFRNMKRKNVVSWTAMVVGYGQNGYSEEAVQTFCEMQKNMVKADEFTLGSVISSCANLASSEEGAQFHCQALVSGLISFITVSNALVTLYGKCGSIDESHKLFCEIEFADEISWTALVSGYAQFGKATETIDLFEKMLTQRLQPDGVTFVGVLAACSRAGLVDKGKYYFDSMVRDHKITPTLDHYTCMIDLLSRSGQLEEAKHFIEKMPYEPDAIGWATLLSSCRTRGNMELGKWAAESLLQAEPQNPGSYVLLISLNAARGEWDEVARLRKLMRDRGVKKEPGFSWIKYKNKLHVFSADDKSSPYSDKIYAELESLYRRMIEDGYIPDVSSVQHNVEDSEKVKMLNHHSEKLAIAFGLIFVPPGLPIKVVKNLRVCLDCHNATKIISRITGREILVRDSVRFHLFKDGKCSCGDFW